MTISLRQRCMRLIRWLGGLDLLVMLAVLAIVASSWVFLKIASAVTTGQTQRIDEWVVRSSRNPENPIDPIGPPWLEEAARDLTALGGFTVLSLVTAAVVGYLLLSRRYYGLCLVLLASGGGLILSSLLKAWISRPRPDVVPHLAFVSTASFPSGHSMLSAVIYLTLGAALARLVAPPRQRMYFLSLALLVTLLVGVSRVYLGVHYPTDVLAGWAAGLVWAIVVWLVARWLQRRGIVEKPRMEGAAGETG